MLSVGGFRLPQNFGSSTLSLVIAAPGILMFGPHASSVSSESRPVTVVVAGLDLLLVHDLVGEHGERGGLRHHRLLDLHLQPSLADQIETDRRAIRGHHHDLARLLAGRLEHRGDRHREMRGVREDQVDVGIGENLVRRDVAGVASASHCMAACVMIVTSGWAAIFSSKPFWISSV